MKKIIFLATLLFTAGLYARAQDAATNHRLLQLAQSYYQLKEALTAGNSKAAGMQATSFIKNLNGISYKVISEGNVNTLLVDAGVIADAKDIGRQRAAFSNLSGNMVAVAKSVKLTSEPVYIQYCPMKKAYWLSDKKTIENPYYGSSMLSCGEITDTIE